MTVIPPEKGLAGLRDVDMVVEVRFTFCASTVSIHHLDQAVSENLELKKAIFRNLSAELNPHAILASNTSSISITKIAASTIPDGQRASSTEGQQSASRVVGKLNIVIMYPQNA